MLEEWCDTVMPLSVLALNVQTTGRCGCETCSGPVLPVNGCE